MVTRFAAPAAALSLVLAGSGQASALSEDEGLRRAEATISEAEAGIAEVLAVQRTRQPATAEERLAAGELFLRNKNFARAITSFNQVIELRASNKASAASHADALYLLGEAYFRDDQLMSARRQFRRLAELGTSGAYAAYVGRALGRLVDVALRTDRLDDLDFIFAQIKRVGQIDTSGSLAYARGKAYFARRSYEEAERSLLEIADASPLAHQGGYLLGVIYLNLALQNNVGPVSAQEEAKVPNQSRRFARAILQFQKVTRLNPDTQEHQHVIDLAWMAIGRLFYETDSYSDAIDAYSHVARTSPEFANSLFELSWVYVRAGVYRQAQRALEVLAVVSPQSLTFAEGALLRADLMLRSEKFTDALTVYQEVRSRFAPIGEEVDAFLAKTTDPAVYYDRLIEERVGVRTSEQLPPVVTDWVREESEDDRVFTLVDDVTRSRDLIRDSRRMVRKMNAVLGSGARAKAFPDIKLRLQHTLGLTNQLTQARRDLALGLEDAEDSRFSGELGQARAERRRLMAAVQRLPVTAGDFSRRENSGRETWNRVSQNLKELTLEADKLQAIVNGLRRILRDADRFDVVKDPTSRERFQAEIEANEQDLMVYRDRIAEYRDLVERGRVQVGFGDATYVKDVQTRIAFETAFGREFTRAEQGLGGQDAASYARRAEPLRRRANAARNRLLELTRSYTKEVSERSQQLSQVIQEEANRVESYSDQLDALDQSARLLVGEVAMRNFGLVSDRLRSLVLRADVGIAQQAWEVRASHLDQVRRLQRQRASEEQQLNDELEEVLHDGVEEE